MDLPPIYLINLDRSTERLRLFNECNGHVHGITRVSAVDGQTLDRAELVRTGYIEDDLKYGPGTLGCAMSHIRLWEVAAVEDRSITIFEDDAVVSLQFETQAREILSALPDDWDLIQWGYNLNPSFAWIHLGVSKIRLNCYAGRDLGGFQSRQFRAAPVRLLHSFGSTAYSISAKGARAALDYCLPLRRRLITFPEADVIVEDTGKDIALCGLYPSIKAFLCLPQLIVPSYLDSDRIRIDADGSGRR